MQEALVQKAVYNKEYSGPWLGPYGMRPVGLGRKPIVPELIKSDVFLLAKTRLACQEGIAGIRLRSPVEICRVRADKPLPTEFGETTLIHVEFLYADR